MEDDPEGSLADHLVFTPDLYSPSHRLVDPQLLETTHECGLRVVPCTVNAREDMRRLIRIGVDGFITDYPDVGTEVLEALRHP